MSAHFGFEPVTNRVGYRDSDEHNPPQFEP